MVYRRSPRVDTTLPSYMIILLKQHQQHSGMTRSLIVQLALREWFAKKSSLLDASYQPAAQYDTAHKTVREYISPSMSSEEIVEVLLEYDATVQRSLMQG